MHAQLHRLHLFWTIELRPQLQPQAVQHHMQALALHVWGAWPAVGKNKAQHDITWQVA